ncbi:NAD(P)H-dependent oxidoreductase [Sphingobacterium sp. SRCM116780]|uniref:NADPH-dependent FMN reductase n=1 Tax=Sphingobacterium sp. SRCM116780 TaxID=2907623 RepID=UPI001F27370A|nr:NAD(P)H-dependent oxidoreductase [Sphingobacterium sp. SRCM116780]UIR56100.1 NAD(P)H-dependent oxidoreductase [Sphingobacterium sp. SRCM116780]
MILIISGTNRPKSKTLKVAQHYQEQLQKKGEHCEILSLTDLPKDIIVSDLYGQRSDLFKGIQQLVSDADKFVFITPEYNGSIPGVLKIFIDACAFPASFFHKKAALIGLSSGRYGNLRGIDHLTGICNYLRMYVLPLKIFLPHIQNEINEEHSFIHEETINAIHEQIEEFVRF